MSTSIETLVGTPFPVANRCPTPQEVVDGAAIPNPGGDMHLKPVYGATRLEPDGTVHFSSSAATVSQTGGPDGTMHVARIVVGIYRGPGHQNMLTLY